MESRTLEAVSEVGPVTAPVAAKRATRRSAISWRIERNYWKRGFRILAGVDEAGRGPLAGPVVASCVVFPYDLCQKLPRAFRGLNDSKQVIEAERERLYDLIWKHAAAVGVGVVGAEEIDKINILRATMKAMTLAVREVAAKLGQSEIELLLIDGNYFRTELEYDFETVIDGDAKSPLIAAASIVAKVTRDRMMRELDQAFPQYNFAKHKGYATKEHRMALEAYGPSPVHRLTFGGKDLEPDLFELLTDESPIPAETT